MSTTLSSSDGLRPLSLEEFKKRRRPLRDYSQPEPGEVKPLDKLAVWITERVGTIGFFLVIFFWTVLWLGWNLLAPQSLRFDPPMGFVFWLFISNVIQILLMPLIMLGQNIQGRHSERRAQHDLEVNVRAEEEIEVILSHLEYQNALLIAVVRKLGLVEEPEGVLSRDRTLAPSPRLQVPKE
jgi:uncharacterized membrane protein